MLLAPFNLLAAEKADGESGCEPDVHCKRWKKLFKPSIKSNLQVLLGGPSLGRANYFGKATASAQPRNNTPVIKKRGPRFTL